MSSEENCQQFGFPIGSEIKEGEFHMGDNDTVQQRTREAAHLQMIEGNPLDAADIAMFEMFDREGFSVEQQLAYVHDDLKRRRLEKEGSRVPALNRR